MTALQTAEAQLAAIDEQIREQRVELGLSPRDGARPRASSATSRCGSATASPTTTVLTTVDDNQGLEVYLHVPVQQAPDLTVGLPVRIVDDRGARSWRPRRSRSSRRRSTRRRSRCWPRRRSTGRARSAPTSSCAPASSGRTAPGLTVPLVAVDRGSTAGSSRSSPSRRGRGATVARQRPIELGPLTGNDYVVTKGLKAGERLIVSGVQKIGDGAPVQPTPPAPPPADGRAAGEVAEDG